MVRKTTHRRKKGKSAYALGQEARSCLISRMYWCFMTPDQRIARIAALQHGLFTNPQALAAGLSATAIADRVRAGRLHRLEPQVYRIAGAPDSWHQRLMAACLAESGVASHRAAASLFELDGFPPRVVEVTVRRWKRRVNCSLRVHESTDLSDTHRSERRGIPVTTIERTLIDLGAVVPRIRVEQAFDDALQRRLTTPELVRDRFLTVARRGRRGVGVIRPLLERRLGTSGPRPGEFERRVARLLVVGGLAEPTFEHEIRLPGGRFVARVDLAYPPALLAIECDSDKWRSGRQRRQADFERQNRLILAGWTLLRFTWDHLVDEPHLVLAQVASALHSPAPTPLQCHPLPFMR